MWTGTPPSLDATAASLSLRAARLPETRGTRTLARQTAAKLADGRDGCRAIRRPDRAAESIPSRVFTDPAKTIKNQTTDLDRVGERLAERRDRNRPIIGPARVFRRRFGAPSRRRRARCTNSGPRDRCAPSTRPQAGTRHRAASPGEDEASPVHPPVVGAVAPCGPDEFLPLQRPLRQAHLVGTATSGCIAVPERASPSRATVADSLLGSSGHRPDQARSAGRIPTGDERDQPAPRRR
jgi:hypothetical protein